jgi:hypothetical protein
MAAVNTYRDFSFAATETYPIISNIEFLLEPQIVKTLFNVNPLETDIGDFMKMGLMEKVEGEDIIHREDRKILDAPFINSSTTVTDVYGYASVANGDPAAFTGLAYVQLAASAHTPTSGDLTNMYSYPRPGMIVEFNGRAFWRIQGKRTSVANAHRIYLTKVDAATTPDLSSTITLTGSTYGGDQITLPTTLFEENSWGMQEGVISPFKTFHSYISTFGDIYTTTDKQLRNKTYEIIDPATGSKINFYYEIGARKTEVRFMTYEAMGLFVVPKGDASFVSYDPISGTNKTTVNSDGYINVLENNAPHKQYDDNITLTLFKDVARLRNRLNQSGDSMVWHGPEFAYRVSDLVTELGKNGSIVYGHKAVDLGISTIEIPGANFNTKPLRILDNPQLTNIPGRQYPWYFIVKPMDQTQDAKTGIPMDCFTIMYKEQDGGGARGHYKVWYTGAYAPNPTSTQRNRQVNYASNKGIRVVGAEKHILGVSSQF